MSQARAREILEPHHDRIHRIMRRTSEEYKKCPAHMARAFAKYPGARAYAFWAVISTFAEDVFVDVPEVTLVPGSNGFALQFGNELLLRFNKMGPDGSVSISNTARSREYHSEQPDFDGISSADLKLVCGYLLNDLKTSIETVMVSQIVERSPVWTYAIPRSGDEDALPITTARAKPLAPMQGGKVRGRGGKARGQKDKEGTTGDS